MKKIVILDTNILRKERTLYNINKIISDHSDIADIYITQTVLDEITQFYRGILDTEIIPPLKNYSFLFEILEIDYNQLDLTQKKPNLYIKNYIKKIFKGNIIPLNSISIEEVYKRAMLKKPPFENNASNNKSSDRGLKDTMIWLSILKFSYKNYSEVIFITNDRDFQNNKEKLIREFKEKHEIPLIINHEYITKRKKTENDIPKTISKNKEEKNIDIDLENYHKMGYFKEKLDDILNELLLEYENFHERPKFTTNEHVNIDDFDFFKLHINKLVKKYSMVGEIHPSDLLEPYLNVENVSEVDKIEVKTLVELLEIMMEFENDLPMYTNAFLSSINKRIEENTNMFVEKNYNVHDSNYEEDSFVNINDDELPF